MAQAHSSSAEGARLDARPPQPRLVGAACLAMWLAMVAFVAWQGHKPNDYLIHVRGISAPQPYPWARIMVEALCLGAAWAALAWGLTRRGWRAVAALLGTAVVAACFGVLAAWAAMHGAPHQGWFALLLQGLAALALLCLLLTRPWRGARLAAVAGPAPAKHKAP